MGNYISPNAKTESYSNGGKVFFTNNTINFLATGT